MSAHSFAVGAISLTIDDHGPDEAPAVVVLHGFAGSAGAVDELVRPLVARGNRVLVPDLVGHGRTDAPSTLQPYRMEACVDQLQAACEKFRLRSVTLVGYSMGGRTALHWAVRHPTRVARLVTIGATPGQTDPQLRRERRLADEALADRIEAEGVVWFDEHWASRPIFASQRQRVGADRLAELGEIRRGQRAVGLANSLRGMGTGAMRSLSASDLGAVDVPALIVAGADDDRFCTIGQALADDLGDGRFRAVADAGHAAHLEQPDALAQLVEEFVAP